MLTAEYTSSVDCNSSFIVNKRCDVLSKMIYTLQAHLELKQVNRFNLDKLSKALESYNIILKVSNYCSYDGEKIISISIRDTNRIKYGQLFRIISDGENFQIECQ